MALVARNDFDVCRKGPAVSSSSYISTKFENILFYSNLNPRSPVEREIKKIAVALERKVRLTRLGNLFPDEVRKQILRHLRKYLSVSGRPIGDPERITDQFIQQLGGGFQPRKMKTSYAADARNFHPPGGSKFWYIVYRVLDLPKYGRTLVWCVSTYDREHR